MRLLFVKQSLAWPRASGHDVHTYYMMKACAGLGHAVALATIDEPVAEAIAGLTLESRFGLDAAGNTNGFMVHDTWLQKRFRSFWGVSERHILAVRKAVESFKADAVVVSGLDALPYFPSLSGVTRIWYAADEWMLHHLTQIQLKRGRIIAPLRAAAIKGVYERAHRKVVDRVWVVSEGDRQAMRWAAGMAHVDLLPNGVDGDYFAPGQEAPEERTAAFWGRLDFGPNIQALEWFCGRVWPLVRRAVPDARFTVMGFHPTAEIRALAGGNGIAIEADLPDLRKAARRHALAVLPFVSGAGIKNKLLEAAALGIPIVCTPLSTRGLRGDPPLTVASRPDALSAAIVGLWNDAGRRRELAGAVRRWVLQHHTWVATARDAMAALERDRQGARA